MNHKLLTIGMAGLLGLGIMAGCHHHHPDDNHPDNVVLVDRDHHFEHNGYYDEHHDWHGGYYDEQHMYHDDPHDFVGDRR